MLGGKITAGAAALAGVAALLIAATPSAAHDKKQAATGQVSKRPDAETKTHRLVLQVNSDEPATMNLALNNAMNATQHYKDLGEQVAIEIITFGPGLHMLRDDTSPVKARIKAITSSTTTISFKAARPRLERGAASLERSDGARA